MRSLEGLSPTRYPSVPVMAIPTTAGTAAEVTINYVITDEEKRRKFVCVDPHDIPQVAFIDADMMDGMPPALKAATGVDALTHAIEGYITRAAWALTDALHIKAIEIIAGALRGSVAGEREAGEAMALGQYVAGMGFSTWGLGWCTGWRIRWARFITLRTALLMRFFCRMSCATTRNIPVRSSVISRVRWARRSKG